MKLDEIIYTKSNELARVYRTEKKNNNLAIRWLSRLASTKMCAHFFLSSFKWHYDSIEYNIYKTISTIPPIKQCKKLKKKRRNVSQAQSKKHTQCGLLKFKHLEKVSRFATQACCIYDWNILFICVWMCFFYVMNSFFFVCLHYNSFSRVIRRPKH